MLIMSDLRHTKDLVGKPVEVRVLFRALLFGNQQLRELKKLHFLCPKEVFRPFSGHFCGMPLLFGWLSLCTSHRPSLPHERLYQNPRCASPSVRWHRRESLWQTGRCNQGDGEFRISVSISRRNHVYSFSSGVVCAVNGLMAHPPCSNRCNHI